MTIHYLLDTGWVIHYLNAHQGSVARLRERLDDDLISRSSPPQKSMKECIIHAIRQGMNRSSMIFYAV